MVKYFRASTEKWIVSGCEGMPTGIYILTENKPITKDQYNKHKTKYQSKNKQQ